MKKCLLRFSAVALAIMSVFKASAQTAGTELVYVGSGDKNIYAYWLDLGSGSLKPAGEVAEIKAPSFLALSPDEKFLCAISEGSSKRDSAVSSFGIDAATGKLRLINRQLTGGSGPCHVSIDQKGKAVLVANYNSGSVAAFPLGENGQLGPISAFIQNQGSSVDASRQEGPHAHCIVTGPDDRFVYACDLGLDKILIFKLDADHATLVANDPAFASIKPGSGPRHIAFHPNRRFAYVISEMGGTLTVYSLDSDSGALTQIEDHPLPKESKGGSWAAEVAVHPSGKFVFGSNRGDNSIVVFRCDPETGRLKFIERDSTQGKTPRNFEVDPTGKFLLVGNQDSNSLIVFRIDENTGHLASVGQAETVKTPMCIKCLRPVKSSAP